MESQLIVIRGNSGAGKSSVAGALRQAYGERGLAVVGQDMVRREILRELDVPGGANIGLIDLVTRYALDNGHHVVLEGILTAGRYGEMLRRLHHDHADRSHFFYLDVSFDESLRRHATRPQSAAFGAELMREWYRPRDLLPGPPETIISETSALEETVGRILRETGLAGGTFLARSRHDR